MLLNKKIKNSKKNLIKIAHLLQKYLRCYATMEHKVHTFLEVVIF